MPHLHGAQRWGNEPSQNSVGQSCDHAPVTRAGLLSPLPQLFGNGVGAAAAADAQLLNDSVR